MKVQHIKQAVFIGLVSLSRMVLCAQSLPSGERLRLVYADSLVGIIQQGRTANQLSGRVQLAQGTAFLNCHEAIWYEKEDRISLFGNVVIHDGKRTLSADRVDYDGEKKMETASGNAVLENGRRKISAQTLIYYKNEEQASAEGCVRVEDLVEKALLEGNRVFYDKKKDYCLAENDPSLLKTDSTSGRTWRITGKTMQAWGKDQRALISDSVVIRSRLVHDSLGNSADGGGVPQEDLKGTCRQAEYFTHPNRIVLTRTPVVWQKQRKMRGDSMIVRLNKMRFAGADIFGHAEMTSGDSTETDSLRGEIIRIEAAGDTLRHITVEKRGESVYHVSNEQGEKQGVNSVSGDRMDLVFEDEALKQVTVTSRPALCTGIYTPEKKKAGP